MNTEAHSLVAVIFKRASLMVPREVRGGSRLKEPHGSWGDEPSRVLLSPLLPALLAWPWAGRASSALKRTPCLGPAGADTGARVSNGLPNGAHGGTQGPRRRVRSGPVCSQVL